ncbi:MAG TPA: carbohydrate ABC transporter permease [Solirubrobacteraceae bacterium]|nr:carbohydrate ABC transporter permease [Solirubrobacteraceae bacterium]
MRRRKRQGWHRYVNLVTIGATLTVLFVLLPLYWMISSSLKGPSDIGSASALPQHVSGINYSSAFVHSGFGHYIVNSVIVAVCTTALVLALGTMAGYALGRLPMRAKLPTMVVLLMISVFPAIAVIAPLFLLMKTIGWLNSYQALIVPYTAFNLPFAVWILRNYMLGIPREMEETARIDGAGPFTTLWRIIIPQARPGLFTAGIFTFTACWTEFLMALSFNSDNSYRTIPVGIALFGSQFTIPYGTIFAASTAAAVPIAILVLVFRRSVVSGLTAGAVKG